MKIPYTHESIRLTGRWDTTNPNYAEATATGSYIEFAFEGDMALVCFDVTANATPYLHLWVEVDRGARVEVPIDNYLRITTPTYGKHTVRIIYKGGTEANRRWYRPLTGKVSFVGVEVEKPLLPEKDDRPIIEFVGDSITEGVLIDVDFYRGLEGCVPASYIDQNNRCYQDDVCATYAWLTAERLNLRPVFMGYGATGATKSGMGKVRSAPEAYPYNFDGSPVTRETPDIVLINHGANDRGHSAEEYVTKYGELLDVIRAMNPNAKLIALSAFCGGHHEALGAFIKEYNEKNGTSVAFIDSTGWIPVEPLHPLRDGHKTVADHLTPILKDLI